jgi:RNA polymerase sigma factor for flagellar operon FliA
MYVHKDGETTGYAYSLEDCSSPDPLEVLLQNESRDILVQAINKLEEKDRLVLALYYQEELTLKEIGKIIDVSESRVCQLHSRAIKRLKSHFRGDVLCQNC